MRGNRGVLLVCPTSYSLIPFESPLLLGARPSKRKIGDGNSFKDERRRKKAKVKSTMLPGAEVVELINDALTSSTATTTPNLPSTLTPPASSPPPESSTSTAVSNPTTHISHTAAILPSESRFPSASELSVSPLMQGQQTNTCNTAPEKSGPSSENSLSTAHAPIQGMLTEL